MLTHPMVPCFSETVPRRVCMVPQRVPRKTKFHLLAVVACLLTLTLLPFLPSCVTTLSPNFFSYLPASSPNEVPTPGLRGVRLGGIQPKTIKHPNVHVQEGSGYTVLEIGGNVRDWSITGRRECFTSLCESPLHKNWIWVGFYTLTPSLP